MADDKPYGSIFEDVDAAVTACEHLRAKLLLDEDWDGFADMLTEDIVHVHGGGIVQGKVELLAYNRNVIKFVEIERGHLNIRPVGSECVIMTGPMKSRVIIRENDKAVESAMFVTQVWVSDSEVWRIASFHAVRID